MNRTVTCFESGRIPVVLGVTGLQLRDRSGQSVDTFSASQIFKFVEADRDGVSLVKKPGADVSVDGHKDDVAAAARQFAPSGLDAALITAGRPTADKALTAMRAEGRVAYPNGVEPGPKAPLGIEARSYDGMPDPQSIEKLNRLIESSTPPGIGPFEVHVARSFSLEQAAGY